MNKEKLNNAIGFGLIFLILFAWMQFNKPSREKLEAEKRTRDSIAQLQTPKPDTPANDSITNAPGLST
ncbi:MAG TPA: hypothetical protein PLQ17_12450, partial [Saprospiraceae bacterium]|nr:hypothetical protein [Saprospiraceae bacterium]